MAAGGESEDEIEDLQNRVDNKLNISDGNEQHGSETSKQKFVIKGARRKSTPQSAKKNDEGILVVENKDGKWLKKHLWDKTKTKDILQKQMTRTVDMSQVYTVSDKWRTTDQKVNLENIYLNLQSAKKNDEGILVDENEDGKWLKKHPWDNTKTKDILQKQMTRTVDMSQVYTVSDKWRTTDQKVNLENIYLNLPEFIKEMKGPSIRHELEAILQSSLLTAIDSKEKPTPHVLEIITEKKNRKPTDKPSVCNGDEKERFKAYSLNQQNHQPSENNYWYLDCEYMLTMYLSDSSWFGDHDQEGKRIRAIKPCKKEERWIFIPSFRRAQIALLDWPEDEIVTPESTIRILVVRPSEFNEYVKYCGHLFPIICLPQDEIGAGYPRFWIQKIALRLKLDFIWMIDDSVECFNEYHPTQPPAPGSYKVYRRRKFGLVFQKIEKLVKATKKITPPIAAMSPKRFMGGTKVNEPFVCSPPRIAVFLNLAALKSKDVYYRPELQALEDMIFGYECEQNGLKVFIDNRIQLQDHDWKDTGARSASVQQKQKQKQT